MRKQAGLLLAIGGVGFFLAGALHPSGHPGQNFQQAIISMLHDPMWNVAHWCALVAAFLVAWALFLLLDERESGLVILGIRLGLIATIFMSVEFSVELAARAEGMLSAGTMLPPLLPLVDAMQAVGFPAFGLAFVLLSLGTRWTPRWVIGLAVLGSVALGVGGLVVQGLHVVALGPVFLIGNALPIWMVWAGIHLMRSPAASV